MKNNFLILFFLFFFHICFNLNAQELEINSTIVKYDNINKITIFEGNVNTVDAMGNKLFSNFAKYNQIEQLIKTQGDTKIETSGGYLVRSKDVIFDNKKKIIFSNKKTQIEDKDGNNISVEMFNYSISSNIFFSKGNIEIIDVNNNKYNFSEIYIDEKKKQIIGSDVKAFLKQDGLTADKNNEPRFFANTMTMSKETNILNKGIFTYCKNRPNGKCPPWTLQSKKIKHDLAKKTIYYDNVVLKVYDFPIFFSPKFSHPDPTVKRKSGFLVPSFVNSSSLGSGFSVPYFLNISDDKDLTFRPKLYLTEKPLLLAEYRQDFKNSFLIIDTGYTQGYKKQSTKKTSGGRAHMFANFNMSLIEEDEKNSNFEMNIEKVSNDTYLKIYDLETTLVKSDKSVLENTIDLTYQNKDFYFGFTPSLYEDMNKLGRKRLEYLLPVNIEKNILSNDKYGFVDLSSNLKIRNFETNKQTNFFVNDFNWSSNKWINKFGIENYFKSSVKTVNYEANNTSEYKNDTTNTEVSSALGYFAKLAYFKKDVIGKNFYTLTPKFLLRYAPGHMRNIDGGKLNYGNLFNLNKINELDVIESGLSTSLGFEYKKNKLDSKNILGDEIYSFSAGQVISAEENMDIPSSTSLDQQFSDVVGKASYNINNRLSLNYNFSIDQSYKNFNYNEIGGEITINRAKFNLDYLQEKNHIGNQEFIQTGLDIKINNSSEVNFSTKRNLLSSSAEFYNLSYNYINDCLKAGIAYRREFYTDRDIEPANNLMFTISIIPFATINSPKFSE